MVSKFQSFVSGVHNSFVEELPLHVKQPTESIFCILSNAEYELKSHQEIQDLLREKHIIVTGIPFHPMEFDEEGLETLKAMDATIDIGGNIFNYGVKTNWMGCSQNRIQTNHILQATTVMTSTTLYSKELWARCWNVPAWKMENA